jgi:uncharacterized protein (DUF302 family)
MPKLGQKLMRIRPTLSAVFPMKYLVEQKISGSFEGGNVGWIH